MVILKVVKKGVRLKQSLSSPKRPAVPASDASTRSDFAGFKILKDVLEEEAKKKEVELQEKEKQRIAEEKKANKVGNISLFDYKIAVFWCIYQHNIANTN